MVKTAPNYRKYLWILIILSTITRGFLAAVLELGNDEVYYRLFALYPDLSHFDHPPMVGLVIQIFSFNLLFESEFFLRLSSVVIGSINIWLVFDIGKLIRSQRAGLYAALLYTASIYAFVISGVFILPDTPQGLFWLLALRQMLLTLQFCPHQSKAGIRMLNLGMLLGLGILSKYTSVFLWLGTLIFILIYNREWLRSKWLYFSVFISICITFPIVYWNYQYDFISIGFQGERVNFWGSSLNFNYFFSEIAGEILYNNPVNFILIVIAVFASLRGRLKIGRAHNHIILFAALPIIFSFLVFSLFRSTLPHWSAPGYTSLIFLASVWLDQKTEQSGKSVAMWLTAAISILILVLVIGIIQVQYSVFKIDFSTEYHHLGKDDPSLDLYGYEQVGNEFAGIVQRDRLNELMPQDAILIGNNWFPLANYDYYAASPIGMRVFGIGKLDRIHKYAWINQENGGLLPGMNAYYITDSRDYHSPFGFFEDYFEIVESADTIQIYSGDKIVKRAFIFRLKNLQRIPDNQLQKK